MMKYKGYVGKTEVDEENNIIHGEVLGIRDVITFQANSIGGLRKAFQDSVDDYLAFCKERGEEPNKPFSGRLLLRIDADLHRQADMAATATGKSLNTLVAESVSALVHRTLGMGVPAASTVGARIHRRHKASHTKTAKSQARRSRTIR